MRVELEDVFDAVHDEILRWVDEGLVTGLRIDHPDGLADPPRTRSGCASARTGAWIVVEKILHPGEHLPASWPVDGTTGYDALNEVAGAFFDPAGREALAEAGERLGVPSDFGAVQTDARRMVTDTILVAEVRPHRRAGRRVDAESARQAVAETFVAHRVYRSYLPEGADDWAAAIGTARERRPDLTEALDALDAQVTADPGGELAVRVQQTSGMVVAKGTEDTSFYRATTFAAANEVGGTGGWWAHDREGWEQTATRRSGQEPAAMTALTTHDTKRSEDTRARMKRPVTAGRAVARRRHGVVGTSRDRRAVAGRTGLADPRRRVARDGRAARRLPAQGRARGQGAQRPGTRPTRRSRSRCGRGPRGSARTPRSPARSPRSSSACVRSGVRRARPEAAAAGRAGRPGRLPGHRAVGPVARRPRQPAPVDYAARRALLAGVDAGAQPEVDDDGAAKLLLTARVLRLRRDRPDLFEGFEHVPAMGPRPATRWPSGGTRTWSPWRRCAAARWPRRAAGRTPRSSSVRAPGTDVLTGREHAGPRVPLADLTAVYPVALVTRK